MATTFELPVKLLNAVRVPRNAPTGQHAGQHPPDFLAPYALPAHSQANLQPQVKVACPTIVAV